MAAATFVQPNIIAIYAKINTGNAAPIIALINVAKNKRATQVAGRENGRQVFGKEGAKNVSLSEFLAQIAKVGFSINQVDIELQYPSEYKTQLTLKVSYAQNCEPVDKGLGNLVRDYLQKFSWDDCNIWQNPPGFKSGLSVDCIRLKGRSTNAIGCSLQFPYEIL